MNEEKKNLNPEDMEEVSGGYIVLAKEGLLDKGTHADKVAAPAAHMEAVNGLFKDNIFTATLAEANAVAVKLGIKPFADIQEAKAWALRTKSPMSISKNNKII